MKSTFIQDFNIANRFGASAVKGTYRRSTYWVDDPEMWAEMCITLNQNIWNLYQTNEPLARVYNDLWQEAMELGRVTYEGDEARASTFYQLTD